MPYRFDTTLDQTYCPLWDPVGSKEEFPGLNFDSQLAGEWIDPQTVHKTFKCKSRHKRLYDLLGISGWFGVSEEAKQIIEELEPNVHQFFPVETLKKNGDPYEGQYYIMNICQVIDAIIEDKSDVVRNDFTNYYTGEPDYRLKSDPSLSYWRIVFDEKLIKGKHIWRGKHHLPLNTYCSDEFKNALDSAGFKKWEFIEASQANVRQFFDHMKMPKSEYFFKKNLQTHTRVLDHNLCYLLIPSNQK